MCVPRRRYTPWRLHDQDTGGADGNGMLGDSISIALAWFVIVRPDHDHALGERLPIGLAGGLGAAGTGDANVARRKLFRSSTRTLALDHQHGRCWPAMQPIKIEQGTRFAPGLPAPVSENASRVEAIG